MSSSVEELADKNTHDTLASDPGANETQNLGSAWDMRPGTVKGCTVQHLTIHLLPAKHVVLGLLSNVYDKNKKQDVVRPQYDPFE
jgi:hypothetical protein